MHFIPNSIKKIIDHFDALPGIGPKHATRLALHLLNRKEFAARFIDDVNDALKDTTFCKQCQNISDQDTCVICRDSNRDSSLICVVAHVQDLEPIEATSKYNGLYHILHGMISPLDGVTPDQIKLTELFERIKKDGISEVILALDATTEGEATTLFLRNKLKGAKVTVTKLARGIPMGSSIEYTDEVTLSSALENRK